jgi:putative heme iron utilization protein
MDRAYKDKIIHNNIIPSNMLLHFPPNHVDRVYTGVCNWGLANRTIKDIHFFWFSDNG